MPLGTPFGIYLLVWVGSIAVSLIFDVNDTYQWLVNKVYIEAPGMTDWPWRKDRDEMVEHEVPA